MSEKEETGRCWVVRWRMEEKSSVLQDFLQVLPWGEGPFLVANLVEDFSVTYDATRGVEILSYTEPSGNRFDIEGGKVLRNSSPVQVKFELQRRAS